MMKWEKMYYFSMPYGLTLRLLEIILDNMGKCLQISRQEKDRDKMRKINTYLNEEIDRIVRQAMRTNLNNKKESAFLVQYSCASMKASCIRNTYRHRGKEIPPFLVADLTYQDSYGRAHYFAGGNGCRESELTAQEWGKVFKESSDLGIGIIFLTGEEPLCRKDVIEEAALHRTLLFPIMTQGNHLSEYLDLFDKNRNLIPILLLNGEEEKEEGFSFAVQMEEMQKRGLFYGVAIRIKENSEKITKEEYLQFFQSKGCGAVIYCEHDPFQKNKVCLTAGKKERKQFMEEYEKLRQRKDDMTYLALPGLKEEYGCCQAAGEVFFSITPDGNAKPCLCAPDSDVSVRNKSLLEILDTFAMERQIQIPAFFTVREEKKVCLKQDDLGKEKVRRA
jgi:MoaA/NifB/PqqE/SkfB family radical SAM enzyme